jgi:hypothetical protein
MWSTRQLIKTVMAIPICLTPEKPNAQCKMAIKVTVIFKQNQVDT